MFLTRRFYIIATLLILLIAGGYVLAPLLTVGGWAMGLFLLLTAVDMLLLYAQKGIRAERHCPARFSNGDDNNVRLSIESTYPFPVQLTVIDEIPAVFQRRDICMAVLLPAGTKDTAASAQTSPKRKACAEVGYTLRPVTRGVCSFGVIRIFTSTLLYLVERRYSCGHPQKIKVYPSFLMLRQYELLAISNRLTELGIKHIRRVGHHTEFEQIKDYVVGDDYRTINWRATARRHQFMVNVYQDERSQQIYNVIDKGRVMQQASRGMTLLDSAINASLVLSFVATNKEDKAGLVTFNEKFDTFVPASRRPGHLQVLQESLYALQTTFGETDFSALVANLNLHLSKRSLLVLYTNFTGLSGMKRQLPYLMQLNRRHRLLVVFFGDSELQRYIHTPAHTDEEYYQHVIAEKFAYEQQVIVSVLKQYGIYSLLTTSETLSVDVINKYLEMKTRQILT